MRMGALGFGLPLVLSALAGGVSAYALVRALASPGKDTARLAALRRAVPPATREPGDGATDGHLPRSRWSGVLRDLTPAALVALVERVSPAGDEAAAAARESGLEPVDVRLAAAAAGLAVAAAATLLAAGRGAAPQAWVMGLTAIAALVGPGLWLSGAVSRYRASVARELPKVAALLTLGGESGLELMEAVRLAAGLSPGPVGRVLRRALAEVDAGREKIAALRAAGRSAGSREVQSFIAAVTQGLQLGTPVSRVLRIQADNLQARRRQALEARISGLPTKLTVVTVVFFLPALFVLSVLPNLLAFLGSRW